MKNKYLLTDAMGSIDDDIILDAKQDNGVKTVSKARATVLKIAIIAATVAIIAACILTAFLSKSATQDEPQQEEYKIFCSSDVYDSVGIFPYDPSQEDYVFADNDAFADYVAPKNFELNTPYGTVVGKYENTREATYTNYYPTYNYVCANKDQFSIDPFGQVTAYYWFSLKDADKGKVLSEDEIEQAALNTLSFFVNDINRFVIEETKFLKATNISEEEYKITLAEFVNGTRTSGCVTFYMRTDGTPTTFHSYMLSQIKDGTENPFDMEKVKALAKEYLNQRISSLREPPVGIIINEERYELTVLKTGELAIQCVMNISLMDKETISGGKTVIFVITK